MVLYLVKNGYTTNVPETWVEKMGGNGKKVKNYDVRIYMLTYEKITYHRYRMTFCSSPLW